MHLTQTGFKSVLAYCLFIFFFASCGHNERHGGAVFFTESAFTKKIKAALKPTDTANLHILPVADDVRYVYQLNEYTPIWVGDKYKPNHFAARLLNELDSLRWDGLNTGRYKIAELKLLKEKLDTSKDVAMRDAVRFDTELTHYYFAAARDLMLGQISPRKADSLWYHINDTTWNAPRILAQATDYPSLDAFRSKVPTYRLLRNAYVLFTALANDSLFNDARTGIHEMKKPDSGMIENINWVIKDELPWVQTVPNDTLSEEAQLISAYQFYNNLKVTGKLDSATYNALAMPADSFLQKIVVNMERIRWMQQQFGDLYIVVDVPLMELFLRRDSGNAMHMRTVVGKPERQTPSLYATMANIVINPPWGVPPTILKKDVLPGLEKNKKYLAKKGLKVYDRKGKRINASVINEENYRRYEYKQDPGDDNALGYVKFNLPNPWDIYLHDTPHRNDFGLRNRALSSGCIRLQRPREMAVFILSEIEKKKFTAGKLDTIIDTHKTRWEVLRNKIPVHIAYLTAFEDTTGHLRYIRDIYNRDGKLISVLK